MRLCMMRDNQIDQSDDVFTDQIDQSDDVFIDDSQTPTTDKHTIKSESDNISSSPKIFRNLAPIPFNLTAVSSDSEDDWNEGVSAEDTDFANAIAVEIAENKAFEDHITTNRLSKAVQNMNLNNVKTNSCNDCSYQYNRDHIDQLDDMFHEDKIDQSDNNKVKIDQ